MRPKARIIFFNKYKMLKAKKINYPFASNCTFNTLLKQNKKKNVAFRTRPPATALKYTSSSANQIAVFALVYGTRKKPTDAI